MRNIATENKDKFSDIKKVPKLTGPFEELQYMDLTTFRRLGKNPRKCAMKIKEKVEVLERDGYGSRLRGIKLWRKSPINIMYIQLGSEAINKKADIDVILEEKKMNKEDFLTKEEFRVIMDLNRELRF